jgi:hypothetical protein
VGGVELTFYMRAFDFFSTIDQKTGVYALISVRKTRVFFTVKKIFFSQLKKIFCALRKISEISKIQNKLRRKFY